jgi:hypothetical protein
MSKNAEKMTMIGILFFLAVIAVTLFILGNFKIAWIIIIIGAAILGILLVYKGRSGKLTLSLDQTDVMQFKSMFSEKSSKELKAIYAKRLNGEYRDEAIEAVRQILVERRELT